VVSAGHVLAGSPVHARVGLALVVIDVTVGAAPARIAGTFVASTEKKNLRSVVLYFNSMSFIFPLLFCRIFKRGSGLTR